MNSKLSETKNQLVKNTIIIMMGSFGVRFFTFFLVPFFSFYLTASEIGFFDVMIVTVDLAVPVVTIELTSSLYRWLVVADKEETKKSIISTAFIGFSCAFVLFVCLSVVATSFVHVEYRWLICVYFVTTCLHLFLSTLTRGMKKNELYVFSSLFRVVVLIFASWVLLSVFGFGVKGILLSYILSGIASVFLITYCLCPWRYISTKWFSRTLFSEFISYSLPIVPYTISWWLMNSGNRYIILHFLGSESNGIYAMSTRFVLILHVIYSVFHLAWQESAFTEFNTKHRDKLYSDVFGKYFTLIMTAVIVLFAFSKVFILYFLSANYANAWRYLPALLIGAAFAAFSSFFSTGYTGAKKTSDMMYTVAVGAIVNIVTSYILMPRIGLQGASIGVAIGFFVTFSFQVWRTRKFFKIQIDTKKVVSMIGCVVFAFFWIFILDDLYQLISLVVGALFLFLYVNRSIFNITLQRIRYW